MKEYTIEVYETHSSKYTVYADSLEAAITAYENGEGEAIDNSQEFIEIDECRGFNGIRSIEPEDGGEIGWQFIPGFLEEERKGH